MMNSYKKPLTNYQQHLEIINFIRKVRSKYKALRFGWLLLFLLPSIHTYSQSKKPNVRILFVFDASQSMLGKWNKNRKIDVSTRLLKDIVDSLRTVPNLDLALRVYGHQSHVPPQDCKDTKLEVPFGKGNHDKIIEFLTDLVPRGTTPIAYSLEQAANDFPKDENSRNVIILITDGIEECNGDPCAISAAFQSKGVILKPFVIGVGLNNEIITSLSCIGKFFDASTEDAFRDILNVVITQILYPTTVQVNLLDTYNKARETNVPFTLYDQQTGNMVYNYVHTFNDKGLSDTLYLDFNIKYRLKVHTIPSVEKMDITITPGTHNIIAVNSPQGTLSLKVKGTNQYGTLKCIVREAGEMNTLHVMDFGFNEEFLIGEYDLEVLSTPRILLKKVKIGQSATTTVEIDEPGLLNLQLNPGYGAIYKITGKDMEFVSTLHESATQIALVMQPGTYKVVYRGKNFTETTRTKTQDFTINSGSSTVVNLR